MKRFSWLFIVIFCVGVLAVPAVASALPGDGPVITARGERALEGVHRDAYVRRQQALQRWLLSEQVTGGTRNPIVVSVTREELRRQALGECEDCGPDARKLRVGLVMEIAAPVSFSDLIPEDLSGTPTLRRHGAIRETVDGGYVWTGVAISPGAEAMRIRFSEIFLPPRTELYVYNTEGQAFGPYTWAGPTGDGEFWSNTVHGEVVYMQVRHFGPTAAADLQRVAFDISGIGHIDPGAFRDEPVADEQSNFVGCGTADCVEDASCHNGVSAVSTARDAVGHMQWISGAWIYICSGGLVADRDTSSQIPYFLTANHCISRNKDAKSLEVFWNYETSTCGGSCFDPGGPSTLGASVVASNRTGDYTLMRLNSNPPSGTAYLGWTSDPVALSNGTTLHRISHPNGAPQAYSRHGVDTSAGICSSWPRGSWIYSRDQVGATMGGSSGSPVVNGAGLIVGQLSGGCGTNVNDECDSVNNATVDGAFASYYSEVAPYLGAGSSGNNPPTASFVYSCSGLDCSFDGTGSSDSDGTLVSYQWTFGDGGTASGSQVTHSYGADGTYGVTLTVTDNDNATDSDSKNVTVGGGSCLASGAGCSGNSECCSGNCKGKPGSKTCK